MKRVSEGVPAIIEEEEMFEVFEKLEGNTNRENMQAKYQQYAAVNGYPSVEDMIADIKLKRIREHVNNESELKNKDRILLQFLESIGIDMGHRERNNNIYIQSNVDKLGKSMFS